MRIGPFRLALVAVLLLSSAARSAHAVDPHRSWNRLTTGNGFGFATYDGDSRKLTFMSNHPYVQRSETEQTLNLAFDAYFGVRASGGAAWLNARPLDGLEYREQTHVVHATQSFGPLRTETYVFAPWGLEAPAIVMAMHVTNTSRATLSDAAVYSILNFHLGAGAPAPGTAGEHITWDPGTRSYNETGPSGVTLSYVPFGDPAHHGASPRNPYPIGAAGGTLIDVDDSGTQDDGAAGFQWTFASLAPGADRWVGVVITTAGATAARTWLASREAGAVLDAEVSAWNTWRTMPPAGLSPAELRVWRQSESVIRMAQSREPPPSRGQILASLPPGIWWIAWVRDMTYAMAALARSGHLAEAGLGVEFLQNAPVGAYRMYVGHDYHVSVVRYFGNGNEWSDTDGNGPNVEFDGFGLATWASRLANRREMDINTETLSRLIDGTGLIAADSSIWEVHWNGRQKHFAYTSITAANALCLTGNTMAARGIRDAIVSQLLLPNGGLAGNLEELQRREGALDGATIEAINWGLVNPNGRIARATIAAFEALRTPVDRGYFRNDDGDGYDREEWVFIDLRIASALRRMGRTAEADELVAWVTAQADANFGLQAELLHRQTADYVGAIPMVGFGAGAYMLALMDRTQLEPTSAECFPPDPDAPVVDAGMIPANDGGVDRSDEGSGDGGFTPRTGCACRTAMGQSGSGAWGLALLLAGLAFRRRRRAQRLPAMALLAAVNVFVMGCGNDRDLLDSGNPDTGTSDAARGDAADGNVPNDDVVIRTDARPPTVQGLPVRECASRFNYPLGRHATAVAVGGQWNRFSATADPMSDGTGTGVYRGSVTLASGSYGYKFVADGAWALDPTNGMTWYIDGVENSRLDVPDCNVPELRVIRADVTGARIIEIDVQYTDGALRSGIDPASLAVTMNRVAIPALAVQIEMATARIHIRMPVTTNDKYSFRINAQDTRGRRVNELYVPMWVEDEPFEWSDGPMYFTFTDRFRNGNPGNDAPIAGIDMRANYQGGDLAGVTQSLRDGYFDRLGVRSLWLSPINDNTAMPGRGGDGRMYSAYHGYWVSQPRAVEEHFGSMEDLRALTAEAHRHGIRVLFDVANNQLHREHPYFSMHRDWFNGDGTCVCGGSNCDWDVRALDCWFTSYLPDVNWTNMASADQMIEDAIFWLTEADADGFRVDAVKHMQHIASTTLRGRIRQRLEQGNARYYLVGETFTGAEGRDLIQSFISPNELWGQFDFPLFWAIDRVFAANMGSMSDLDNAVRAGETTYAGALMSPFLGNHDVERFMSRAAGQIMGNSQEQAWMNPPMPPDSDDPYDRLFLAFTFLLTQPGVPLIYYGDEVGLPGVADPDNRRMMRFDTQLSTRESRLIDRVRIVAHARGNHAGLRRGARRTLHTDGDGYVFARGAERNIAIVAINRGTTARSVRITVPAELGADGMTLRDLFGGPPVNVSGGGFDMPFTPRGAALYVQ